MPFAFEATAAANDHDGNLPSTKSPNVAALSKWFLLLGGLLLILVFLGQVAGFKFLQNALVWLATGALAVVFLFGGLRVGIKLLKLGYRLLACVLLTGVLMFSFFTGINVYAVTYDRFIDHALIERLPPREHLVYFVRQGKGYAPAFDEAERAVGVDEIAKSPIKLAVIAVEDQRLNTRLEGPVDIVASLRAGAKTYFLGRRREGGSTLQIQAAKLLNGELKTLTMRGKLRQALIALRLEQRFGDEDHDRLIALYLNLCQLDGRNVGVASAAANLFGISDLRHLTLSQAALLAGMLRSPTKFDPRRNKQMARERRDLVLGLMHDQKLIPDEQFEEALHEEISLLPGVKRMELFVRAARVFHRSRSQNA